MKAHRHEYAQNYDKKVQHSVIYEYFNQFCTDINVINCPPFNAAQLAQIWAGEMPDDTQLCFSDCCDPAQKKYFQ